MVGCDGGRKFYMVTVPGVAKIVAIVTGSAPVILAFVLYGHYMHNSRPSTPRHILIQNEQRAEWELGFLIVVAAALGVTILNLLFYTCCKCLSKNIWSKRFDCAYLTLGGCAQAIVGYIMLASALTSHPELEPVEIKYAAGFLGIVTGIVYWAAATLVNRD